MISRRTFFKLSGLGVAAFGAGAGTASLLSPASSRRFAMYGFLPDDERTALEALRVFVAELPRDARNLKAIVHAKGRWNTLLASAMPGGAASPSLLGGRRIELRLEGITHVVGGDILVVDDRKQVFDPDCDFTAALSRLRHDLRGTSAAVLLSAEYVDETPLHGLLAGERMLVVENERGLMDRIPLSRHVNLDIPGPLGSTCVAVDGSGVRVVKATCRHELCHRSGTIRRPGELVACAPNNVLLRIEHA